MTNEEIIQALQDLIGQAYTPEMRAHISQRTGRNRVHGPRDITSREFDINRITINTDADGNVSGFSFG